MIRDVTREPPDRDEFARFFRTLRKGKGWSADRLSKQIGRAKTFVGRWERGERQSIDREALLKVAELLQITEAEKRKLFRLADARQTPIEAADLYFTNDLYTNVRHAIFDCKPVMVGRGTQVTDQNRPSGFATQQFYDAVGWVLAAHATEMTGELFVDLEWPELLYRAGIIDIAHKGSHPIPSHLVQDELPQISQRTDFPYEDMRYDIGMGMASLWRRWYFSDIRWPSPLSKCALALSSELGPRMSLQFKDSEADKRFGLVDVSCEVVARVARRSLAQFMWTAFQASPSPAPTLAGFPQRADLVDGMLVAAYFAAKAARRSGAAADLIHDAAYILTRPPWTTIETTTHELAEFVADAIGHEVRPATGVTQTQEDFRASVRSLRFKLVDAIEAARREIEHAAEEWQRQRSSLLSPLAELGQTEKPEKADKRSSRAGRMPHKKRDRRKERS